jgi:hypothetical protein
MQLKSGLGIPEVNQKAEPRTGYEINLRSGAIGKIILKYIERTLLLKIVAHKRTIRIFLIR